MRISDWSSDVCSSDLIAYPATRLGWGRLTRLLTTGNLRAKKGECILHLDDLLGHCEDLLLIVMAGDDDAGAIGRLRAACPGRIWLGASMLQRGVDRRRLARLMRMGAEQIGRGAGRGGGGQ